MDQFFNFEALTSLHIQRLISKFVYCFSLEVLAKAIKKKSGKKNIKIFIAFSPKCVAPELCSRSMPSYNRVSEGRIFNMTAFDRKKFFESVVYEVIYLTTRILDECPAAVW